MSEDQNQTETEDLDAPDLKIDTLAGDVRDAMLMRVRDMRRPWSMLSEEEQRDVASGLELAANDLVRRAVRLLTGWEWPSAAIQLADVKIIGGDRKRIEAKIVADNIEHNRNVLGDHVGTYMMLVAVDSETFMHEREPVAIDPDQPGLPGTGDEGDEGHDDENPQTFETLVRKAEVMVRGEGKCSTSLVQRKMAIGYNRAAKVVEELEARGVVSAPDAVGKRTVLPPKPKPEAGTDDGAPS